jgi:hypothetical protein
MKELAIKLKGIKGVSEPELYRFKDFYLTYPQIFSTLSRKSGLIDRQLLSSLQVPAQQATSLNQSPFLAIDVLINRLSFSHFIELLKAKTTLNQAFYEVQAVKNNWSVWELKRAVETRLFERTGLSTQKEAFNSSFKSPGQKNRCSMVSPKHLFLF